jgi:excisionase family DNA binding protein
MNEPKDILTVAEAAEFLSLNKKHVYRLLAARKIPFVRRPGIGYRLFRSQLISWLQEGYEAPTKWKNI